MIAYSLGNFATYGFNTGGAMALTGVLHVTLDPTDGTFLEGRLDPARLAPDGRPAPEPGGAALDHVRSLSQEDFGPGAAVMGDDGTISPP